MKNKKIWLIMYYDYEDFEIIDFDTDEKIIFQKMIEKSTIEKYLNVLELYYENNKLKIDTWYYDLDKKTCYKRDMEKGKIYYE